jgi:anti-sigma regulatory factor (Ser/Thr protein kinase)
VGRVDDAATVRWLDALERFAHVLTGARTVNRVAHAVLAAASNLPGVVRGGIALLAEGGRELRFCAMHEPPTGIDQLPWCALDATADLPLVATATSGKACWFPTIADLANRFRDLAEHQASFGTAAFATLPLVAQQSRVGALMLCFDEPRSFDAVERGFLTAFTAQAASALRRAKIAEQEEDTAQRLHRSLLPEMPPDPPGLAVGAQYEPAGRGAEVGGDWFDVLPLDDGSVLVAIGDVMGRGIAAAAIMGQVRAGLRAYALLDPTPEVILSRLDGLVASFGPTEHFATALVALVGADRKRLRFASAGHPPPVQAGENAPARLVAVPSGPPLAVGSGPREGCDAPMRPGTMLVFCTDGLIDEPARTRDDGLTSLCREVDTLAGDPRLPREVASRLMARLGGSAGRDDRAVLVLASTVDRRVRTEQVRLPADPRASGIGRRWVRDVMSLWDVPDQIAEDVALCLSEVVTNVVIHAETPSRVSAELADRRLLVSVTDAGRHGTIRRLDRAADDIGGRGLLVVGSLADRWESERRADGTTVWFEFELPEAV